MPNYTKNIIDPNINLKETRFEKASFSTEIKDNEENCWSNWVVSGYIQIKLKWNWHSNDKLIIEIHKILTLKHERNPSVNYVYFKYLHKPNEVEQDCYDFTLHEINITYLLPDERRQLINQVIKETGIDPEENERLADNYKLRKVYPSLLLLNELGVELTEGDFYKAKVDLVKPKDEQHKGLEYFGIIPETLLRANKYFAPYTYFFDSIEKKYLLEAIRVVNAILDEFPEKVKNKPYSFKEKLFLMADLIRNIDKVYRNKEITAKENEDPHKIKRFFSITSEGLYEKGMYYYDTKQYYTSVDYFNKTNKQDEFYAPAWYQKGAAYFYLHLWDDALIALNRAIDINPFNPNTYYYRGLTYGALHRFTLSCDDLKQAILLNNQTLTFYSSLAMMYTQIGNFQEAIDVLNKAIDISETDELLFQRAETYYNLIKTKIESNEYKEASELFKEAEEFYQNNITFFKLKVVAQIRSGKKCKKTFRKIRELLHANNNYEPFNIRKNNYKNTSMYASFRHRLWEWKTFFEHDAYV